VRINSIFHTLNFIDHSRILTYAPVALAALKGFGFDEGDVLTL
jgi:hypothetical protein